MNLKTENADFVDIQKLEIWLKQVVKKYCHLNFDKYLQEIILTHEISSKKTKSGKLERYSFIEGFVVKNKGQGKKFVIGEPSEKYEYMKKTYIF